MTTLTGAIPPEPPRKRAIAAMPVLDAAPNFLYKHHKEQWCVLEGLLIPALGKLVLRPGTSLVAANGDPTAAISTALERGFVVIPRDVDGPGTSYVRAHRVKAKVSEKEPDYVPEKMAHLDQHVKVFPGSNHVRPGGKDYAEWAQALVTKRKAIAPCASYVIERMIEDAKRNAAKYRAKIAKNPENEGRAERIEGTIPVLEAELKKASKRESA